MSLTTVFQIAAFMSSKARQQASTSGHAQAARNLRKQGIPLELTLALLFPGRR